MLKRVFCRADDSSRCGRPNGAMEVDVRTLLAALPRGRALSREAWPARHRTILSFLLGAGSVAVVHWRVHGRAQEEIHRVQRLVGDAFDNAPIGMALVGLDGRWLRINSSVTDITGFSSEELLKRTVSDVTHPDDRDDEVLRAQLLNEAAPSYQLERRFLHAEGHAVPVLVTVILLRDRSGRPQYFMLQLQDVAERKRAEEYYRRLYEGQTALVNELQEAHRLKSELFSIVSHEFRTPLAAIIGFTALLSRKEAGELSDEQRESHLQTIARQAERLNRLVENLFFTAHQVEPSLDAVASVEAAVTAVQLQIAETYDDVGWETSIAQGLRPKIAQGALGLTLLNLVSNAIKHATPNTDVRVDARDDQGQVAISVTNVGEPIPVERRKRIFEPFVQSDGAARTAEGLGLGLHIVHKLVVAYGGSVAVDSGEHEVTFTIRLPQDPAPPAARAPLVLTDSGRVA
jgi:PAS domain S-box-containing protein